MHGEICSKHSLPTGLWRWRKLEQETFCLLLWPRLRYFGIKRVNPKMPFITGKQLLPFVTSFSSGLSPPPLHLFPPQDSRVEWREGARLTGRDIISTVRIKGWYQGGRLQGRGGCKAHLILLACLVPKHLSQDAVPPLECTSISWHPLHGNQSISDLGDVFGTT